MMSRASGNRLIVFARNPSPGSVKTRLIPALGADGAYEVYLKLLQHTLAASSAATGATPALWLAGGRPNPALAELLQHHPMPWHPQAGGDLGARMHAALSATLQHAERVVLIGSDCPGYDTVYLEEAFAALDHADVVIGPATDGGYVLIGARQPIAELLVDMPWGTDQVLAITLQRMNAGGYRHQLLPPLRDVDTADDLDALDALKCHAPAPQVVRPCPTKPKS